MSQESGDSRRVQRLLRLSLCGVAGGRGGLGRRLGDDWGTRMEGLHSQREWARGQWVRRRLAEGPPALLLPTCELCRFPREHSGPNSFSL